MCLVKAKSRAFASKSVKYSRRGGVAWRPRAAEWQRASTAFPGGCSLAGKKRYNPPWTRHHIAEPRAHRASIPLGLCGNACMFDPYLQWFKIPANLRPPTHYELLGVSREDADDPGMI